MITQPFPEKHGLAKENGSLAQFVAGTADLYWQTMVWKRYTAGMPRCYKKHLSIALWFSAVLTVPGAALAETSIRLTQIQAECIAAHITTYLETSSDPVILVPENCPNLPTNDDIMAALAPQNFGGGLPEPQVKSGEKADAVLVLLKEELECFGRLFAAGSVVATGNGLISIALDDCGD